MSSNGDAVTEQPQRPRLNLKPRDENAAKQVEMERKKSLSSNPFGDAKPREAVLASRTGKSEEEILREAVKNERLKLRLNSQQLEEKQGAEALVEEVRVQLEKAQDETSKLALEAELKAREAELDSLMDKFAKTALEAAAKGEVVRPSERRAQQLLKEQQQGTGMPLSKGESRGAGYTEHRNTPYSGTPSGGFEYRGAGSYDRSDNSGRPGSRGDSGATWGSYSKAGGAGADKYDRYDKYDNGPRSKGSFGEGGFSGRGYNDRGTFRNGGQDGRDTSGYARRDRGDSAGRGFGVPDISKDAGSGYRSGGDDFGDSGYRSGGSGTYQRGGRQQRERDPDFMSLPGMGAPATVPSSVPPYAMSSAADYHSPFSVSQDRY